MSLPFSFVEVAATPTPEFQELINKVYRKLSSQIGADSGVESFSAQSLIAL